MINVLNKIDKIGGFKVDHIRRLQGDTAKPSTNPDWFIRVDPALGTITLQLQTGPIKEVGVNGIQVDDLIELPYLIIAEFTKDYPCEENEQALRYLEEAMLCLKRRTLRRNARGVEGTRAP